MFLNQKTSGFTLLELIVALAIGAVILVVGVPSFKGTLDNQRMTSATNELVMSLNLAKSEAIKRVVSVRVHLLVRTNGNAISSGPQAYYFNSAQQAAVDDGQIRREYSVTVALRNPT